MHLVHRGGNMKNLLTVFFVVLFSSTVFAKPGDHPGKPGHPNNPGHFGNEVGAQVRKVIKFQNLKLQGQNIIKLKQELKDSFPGINLDSYAIVSASILGQSKLGKGLAALVIGNESTQSKVVSGSPNKWASGNPEDYVRVHFDSPKSPLEQINEKGVWQIHLDGQFIVQNVEVHLVPVKVKTHPKDLLGDFFGLIIDKIKDEVIE